jgi:type VI secretion system secreted protein Hcp
MPLSASLKLATKSGEIKGPSVQEGRKGEIVVNAVRHEVASDMDAKSGKPTKDRTHTALVVTKNVDFSSPHLHEAHAKNDVFTTFVLRFFHMPRSGREHDYVAITLTNAQIASYATIMPHLAMKATSMVHEYEEIAFTYESIDWAARKHESDSSPGSNPMNTSEVEAVFAPDWVEEQAKAAVMDKAGTLKDKFKEALWNEWKAQHPGELPE